MSSQKTKQKRVIKRAFLHEPFKQPFSIPVNSFMVISPLEWKAHYSRYTFITTILEDHQDEKCPENFTPGDHKIFRILIPLAAVDTRTHGLECYEIFVKGVN